MTVNGIIQRSTLGVTSPHEHAFIDIRSQYKNSDGVFNDNEDETVNGETLHKLMINPYCIQDNLVLNNEELCLSEIRAATSVGLKSFVDATPGHIGRDTLMLKRLSELTGLNVIAGCGFYTYDTHPDYVETLDEQLLAELLFNEIKNGIDGTKVHPGIIGELGTSRIIHPREEKVLRVAAIVHRMTGAPIMVHLYPWSNNGIKVLDILENNGVLPEQICICHTDVMLDYKYMLQLLKRGTYLEFDNFGKEFKSNSAYGDFPMDDERLSILFKLIDDGYIDKLLVSCDICLKVLYTVYGGGGYAHILKNIAPMICDCRKDAQLILNSLLIINPANYLDNPMLDITNC